jgi:hypothetical protein
MYPVKFLTALGITLSLLVSCTQGPKDLEDPKRVLSEYISQSFNVRGPEDRNVLLGYLTGEAKIRLAAWSDEQFLTAFTDTKRIFKKLLVREVKPVSEGKVEITYEIIYLDQTPGRDARITNKKQTQLRFESGRWMIAEVKNVKELVEFNNEMALP